MQRRDRGEPDVAEASAHKGQLAHAIRIQPYVRRKILGHGGHGVEWGAPGEEVENLLPVLVQVEGVVHRSHQVGEEDVQGDQSPPEKLAVHALWGSGERESE